MVDRNPLQFHHWARPVQGKSVCVCVRVCECVSEGGGAEGGVDAHAQTHAQKGETIDSIASTQKERVWVHVGLRTLRGAGEAGSRVQGGQSNFSDTVVIASSHFLSRRGAYSSAFSDLHHLVRAHKHTPHPPCCATRPHTHTHKYTHTHTHTHTMLVGKGGGEWPARGQGVGERDAASQISVPSFGGVPPWGVFVAVFSSSSLLEHLPPHPQPTPLPDMAFLPFFSLSLSLAVIG